MLAAAKSSRPERRRRDSRRTESAQLALLFTIGEQPRWPGPLGLITLARAAGLDLPFENGWRARSNVIRALARVFG